MGGLLNKSKFLHIFAGFVFAVPMVEAAQEVITQKYYVVYAVKGSPKVNQRFGAKKTSLPVKPGDLMPAHWRLSDASKKASIAIVCGNKERRVEYLSPRQNPNEVCLPSAFPKWTARRFRGETGSLNQGVVITSPTYQQRFLAAPLLKWIPQSPVDLYLFDTMSDVPRVDRKIKGITGGEFDLSKTITQPDLKYRVLLCNSPSQTPCSQQRTNWMNIRISSDNPLKSWRDETIRNDNKTLQTLIESSELIHQKYLVEAENNLKKLSDEYGVQRELLLSKIAEYRGKKDESLEYAERSLLLSQSSPFESTKWMAREHLEYLRRELD